MTFVPKRLADLATARKYGCKMPIRAMYYSMRLHVPLSVTLAFLEQESAGGQNIYGHDGGPGYWYYGAGQVTLKNYRAYKVGRSTHGSQGVGPMQLTYYALQDHADAVGGCWKPGVNILVGLQLIHGYYMDALQQGYTMRNSWQLAAAKYNAGPSGNLQTPYGKEVRAKIDAWVARLN